MATFILIAKTTLGSNSSPVSFTSIPQTYADLLVVCSARSTRASIQDPIEFRLNGEGTSGYSARALYASTPSSLVGDLPSRMYGYSISANDATANIFGHAEAYIHNYTQSSNKMLTISSSSENNASSAFQGFSAGFSNTASAITSIYIYPANNVFLAGSSFYLYGINNS